MMQNKALTEGLAWVLIIIFSVLFTTCSSQYNTPIITTDSLIERTQTIVVMQINWVESYNDAETGQNKILHSEELLHRKQLITKLQDSTNKKKINSPLHYIANLRLYFKCITLDGKETQQIIQRYNLNLNGYQPIAIHAFLPGKIILEKIIIDQYTFQHATPYRPPVRWQPSSQTFITNFHNWDLKPGTIVYLGELLLEFQTHRFPFGFFPKEQLIDDLRLTKISMRDQLSLTKVYMQKYLSWFPANQLQNLSFSKDWIMENHQLIEKKPTPTKIKTEDSKKDQSSKRDLKKYFF